MYTVPFPLSHSPGGNGKGQSGKQSSSTKSHLICFDSTEDSLLSSHSHLLSSPPPAPSEHGAVRDHAFAAALRQATEPQLQSQSAPLNSGSPNTLQSSASVVRDFRCNWIRHHLCRLSWHLEEEGGGTQEVRIFLRRVSVVMDASLVGYFLEKGKGLCWFLYQSGYFTCCHGCWYWVMSLNGIQNDY
jgi:hypothetical protein